MVNETFERHAEDADLLNDAAATAWSAGKELEAIDFLDQSLDIDPGNAFSRINKFYFEMSIQARGLDKNNRESRHIEKIFETAPPSKPMVSVILPTYNRPEFFEEALSSVLTQTMSDFEVVVVNDGGPADAEKICRKFNDPRIRYVLITHSGLPGALNTGLEIARGKYAAYLDDDDLYKPDHLKTLVNAAEKEGPNTIVYTDAERVVGEASPNGFVWSAPKPFYREDFTRAKLMKQNFIHNQCALHPLHIALDAGGYHEGISFAINWEMWIKLSAQYPFKRVPITTVTYRDRKTGDTMSTDPLRSRQLSRNIILFTHRVLTMRSNVLKNNAVLRRALAAMLDKYPDVIELLDLRHIVSGKPYAMFHELGKTLATSGRIKEARESFEWAIRLSPWELRSYMKWLSLIVKR